MRRIPKDTLVVFFLLALAYAYFYQDPAWNGNSRLGLTAAIVQEGRLTIDSFHENDAADLVTGDVSFYDGHYYTDKAIGSSVLAAIPYAPVYWGLHWLGQPLSPYRTKHLLTLLVIGLPSALAGALIYNLCVRISGSRWRSGVVTAAVALGSMSFPFSVIFFGHQLAAALLWIGFFLIFQLRFRTSPPSPVYALLCGLVPALALITEYTTAIVVLPLTVYYFYLLWKNSSLRRASSILFPLLGGLLPIALLLAYNLQVYGQPLVAGYQYLLNPTYQEAMSQGVMGISWPKKSVLFFETFQPAMGLFWQSPALLMALPGAYHLLRDRRYRVEGGLALLAFGGYLLLNSGYFEWWGAWSSGPRHIIPMLPFLCLPLIFVPRRWFPLLLLLTPVSIAQQLIVAASTVLVPNPLMATFYELGFFEYSTIYSFCLPQLLEGNFAWNLGQALFDLPGWAGLAPLILAIAGVGVYLKRSERREGPSQLT